MAERERCQYEHIVSLIIKEARRRGGTDYDYILAAIKEELTHAEEYDVYHYRCS